MAQGPLATRIVVMAGLPGTGKSTISRLLAAELNGMVLNKDSVRAALFPEAWIDYSQSQDDFCVEILLQVAGYLIRRESPPAFVFIDGRPFAFRYQVDRVVKWAAEAGCELKLIQTMCSDETARQRLSTAHIAKNRNFESYLRMKASFEDIQWPKLVVQTEETLDSSIRQCLLYLRAE
jgi:predicted kinase